MSESSSDESSDESRGFSVLLDEIGPDSSFFEIKAAKPNLVVSKDDSEEESTEESEEDVSNNVSSETAEMFSQVLKNLQYMNDAENVTENESAAATTRDKDKDRIRKSILSKEINDLLLQGEDENCPSSRKNGVDSESDGESQEASSEYTIPNEGVQITLPGTSCMLNRKRRGARDVDALIRSVINKLRANQVYMHKVGLLCWLGYGFHLNRLINETDVMSAAQALLSNANYPKDRVDLAYLEKFTKWFHKLFVVEWRMEQGHVTKDNLLKRLTDKKVANYKELVLLCIATLRAIGLKCRLVMSLYPPNLKIPKHLLPQINGEKKETKSIDDNKDRQSKQKSSTSKSKVETKTVKKDPDKAVPKNSPEGEKEAKIQARKRAAEVLQSNATNKQKVRQKKNDSNDASKSENTLAMKLRSRGKTQATNTTETASESKRSIPKDSKKVKASVDHEMDSDSEEEVIPKKAVKKKQNTKNTKTVDNSKKKEDTANKLLSSDDEDLEKHENIWLEVYVESEESWICVSVTNEKIHCVTEVYKKAKQPVLYIVGWNSEGTVKDVTRRYCPNWLTVTRKQRVDEKWWTETLAPWKEKETVMSKAEDEMLLQRELEQPLPKSVGEYKNHPLYVLQRHLLKYEALYPPDCVPLGHLRTGEAVYSRYCVHTCCSRETWLKSARVVKPGETAYKIVKARPKYDKLSGARMRDEMLELFGKWQTMAYVPPVAKDGIVPRNDYGNVDLFKQCMLPKGTVYIDLPGLGRVARKLNIDCAPAVVGFKFGCMGAVADFQGFVVCEEYEDTLREAWEAEQMEAAKRAKEKREKRIYGNWKKLIKGLLIRKKIAEKYEFEESEEAGASQKRSKQTKTTGKKLRSS